MRIVFGTVPAYDSGSPALCAGRLLIIAGRLAPFGAGASDCAGFAGVIVLKVIGGQAKTYFVRGRGGTGRRTGFRFQRRKSWGFKSLRPHQCAFGLAGVDVCRQTTTCHIIGRSTRSACNTGLQSGRTMQVTETARDGLKRTLQGGRPAGRARRALLGAPRRESRTGCRSRASARARCRCRI